MIENQPSVYNQPTVYNGGGGGLPGDFGKGGSAVLPVGYRQVAAVGVPNGSSLYARFNFQASDIGLSSFDSTGWVIKCGIYDPLSLGPPGYLPFFMCNPYSNPKIYLQKRGFDKLDARNGSSTEWDLPAPGGTIKGCNDFVLSGSTLTMNGETVTNSLAVNGFTFNQIQILPYYEAAYDLTTKGISSRYLKIYDSNGSLFLCFVPCVRESDNMAGMYEIVHDYFMFNTFAFAIEKIEE